MPDPDSYSLGYVSALTDASSIVDDQVAVLKKQGWDEKGLAEVRKIKAKIEEHRGKVG